MKQEKRLDTVLTTEACLTWIGSMMGTEFFRQEIPQDLRGKGYNITHWELMVILVALKLWQSKFAGIRFTLACDNRSVVDIINAGSVKEKKLQSMMREFVYICATGEFEAVAEHILGSDNKISDILSRYHLGPKYVDKFNKMAQPEWTQVNVERHMMEINNNW